MSELSEANLIKAILEIDSYLDEIKEPTTIFCSYDRFEEALKVMGYTKDEIEEILSDQDKN